MRWRLACASVVAAGLVGCNVLSGVGDLRIDQDQRAGDGGETRDGGGGAEDATPLPTDGSTTSDAAQSCVPSGVIETATASPGVVIDDPRIGSVAWADLDGPKAPGGLRARVTMNGSSISHWLVTTGYDFALPKDAIVRGVVVTVMRNATFADEIADYGVALWKSGNAAGLPKLNVGPWMVRPQTVTYGTATDTWGTWTGALINESGFGASIAARGTTASNEQALVDNVTITVHFERCQ